MNIIKCRLCREPFHSYGTQVCPNCMEQIDKDFFIVRDYIYANPKQSKAEQIAEATGVKEAHIVYLLEDGRLSASDGFGIAGFASNLKCQVCGRGIPIGTLCENCKAALTKELGVNTQSNAPTKTGPYISPRSSVSNPK